MDVLINKQSKNYNYRSRYQSNYFYYNINDNKYIYGLTSQLHDDTEFVVHNTKPDDTLDKLALKYYGRPDFFWVIADFNRIIDSYEDISKYTTIKIPNINNISFK